MATTSTTDTEPLAGAHAPDPGHSRVGFVTRHATATRLRGGSEDVAAAVERFSQTADRVTAERTLPGAPLPSPHVHP